MIQNKRNCEVCRKQYQPINGRQKYCGFCRKIVEKERAKKYNQKPEVKLRHKKHRNIPENREKNISYLRVYNQKLEVKTKARAYRKTPKTKRKARIYNQLPRIKIKARTNQLKHNFSLTLKDYLKKLNLQKNKCAICENEEKINKGGETPQLCVDHNHKTKKIRGLLCKRCNMFLGNIDDSISLLQNAIKYLVKYEEIKNG